MTRIAYYRVSTNDQSIEAQRAALGGGFDKEFSDEGVSGATPAAKRPGFAKLLEYVREGDVVHVYAVDRLGRDALDVQATVRALIDRGVALHVQGLGIIGKGAGELVLAVLAQVADIERQRIIERTASGRQLAKETFERTGRTHRGKKTLGRPRRLDPLHVAAWREANGASAAETGLHFNIDPATVRRYCAEARKT